MTPLMQVAAVTPWTSSLATRLLGLALVLVVVPAAIFALLTFSSARQALVSSVGRQLATAAHEAAEHVGDPLMQEQRTLEVWARQPVMHDLAKGDPTGSLSAALADIVRRDPAYRRLEAVRPDGFVVAGSDRERIGKRSGDAEWLARVAGGRSSMQGPETWPGAPGVRVVHLATPIRGDAAADVEGVLRLVLDWRRVESQLARSRADLAGMGLATEVFLVGPAEVIASTAASGSLTSAAVAAVATWRERHPRGAVVDTSARALFGVSQPAAGRNDWGVVVAQSFDIALEPIYLLQRQWIVVFVGILAVAVAVAGIQGNRMIRPLRDLTEVTRQVSATARPMPAPDVSRDDEIGALARSFTQMSHRPERAQRALIEATRLALVGEMPAGVAHEVRTPLSVLRSSTQLLHRALPHGEKNADELARLMLEEIDRLERLVAGLLELARPRPPVRVRTRLSALLNRVTELTSPRAAKAGSTISCRVEDSLAPALCDPDQIQQVALNLVINALEHGGTNVGIEIRGVAEDGLVGFDVADDGPGIDASVRDRVFLPFVTTRADGSGLGLAIVKNIVEAHGGTISLISSDRRGSVFRVLLPMAEAA